MFKAYIKADPWESPEVLGQLSERLKSAGISPVISEKTYKEIVEDKPFLYYRNAYIRFDNEMAILRFHFENPKLTHILSANREVISYNPVAKGHGFVLKQETSLLQPPYQPLPIILGTYRRPIYFRLTLNSLLYKLQDPEQKIYIVASHPDDETRAILGQVLKTTQIEIIVSDNNLGYSLFNFASKYFKLAKFIHFEDDGIVPECVQYFAPFWPRQLNYRSETASIVGFKIAEENWNASLYLSDLMLTKQRVQIPQNTVWHYRTYSSQDLIPIGGMGLVLDSQKHYRGFQPPNYCATDHSLFQTAKNVCLLNVPIYHIGANQDMDYPDYALAKRHYQLGVEKIQTGTNLRTGEKFTIDLSMDWSACVPNL